MRNYILSLIVIVIIIFIGYNSIINPTRISYSSQDISIEGTNKSEYLKIEDTKYFKYEIELEDKTYKEEIMLNVNKSFFRTICNDVCVGYYGTYTLKNNILCLTSYRMYTEDYCYFSSNDIFIYDINSNANIEGYTEYDYSKKMELIETISNDVPDINYFVNSNITKSCDQSF